MYSLLVERETSKSSETLKETHHKTEPWYINVRTSHEFETVHIEGAINFPLQDWSSRMDELKRLAEQRPVIVLYRTQNRAKQACAIFANHGLNNLTLPQLRGTRGVDDPQKSISTGLFENVQPERNGLELILGD